MNSAAQVDNLVNNWRNMGLTKAEIVVKQAEAMLGWPYVWGASGQDCTVEKRRYFMNRSSIGEGDKELIRKRCQVLNGSKDSCDGCTYYPNNARTRIQDCQGFEKEIHKKVGITLKGGGATSMYNDNSNWVEKGEIKNMPLNAVCLVFKHISSTGKMDHVGQHIGGGQIIHCSGTVKRGNINEKGWTHYAIPKGLQGGVDPSLDFPTLRRGSKGEYVTLLQTQLHQKGYDIGSAGVDGDFGRDTESAVKLFQKNNGLVSDGVVGQKTWSALMDGEQKLYTVTIPHLTATVASELEQRFPDCSTVEEKKG